MILADMCFTTTTQIIQANSNLELTFREEDHKLDKWDEVL